MPEIATAWVTLTVSARNARRDVQRELNGIDGTAAGRRAGQQISSGVTGAMDLSGAERKMLSMAQSAGSRAGQVLGNGLKVGAAAGVAALGTSIKLGVDRLLAIDDAKGKLKGLGHDAQSTAKIMDSALASVKGTAFGLGDAATISASAVAAGIKPGQDLTKYLKLTADAASIAGSSLGDMGHIFNQVQTGQRAMSDDLNQLGDRGIPILQWVGKEMGVTADQVKKMAADGQVSSEIFFRAIQKNIGGAALASGNTVRGSFNNAKAAAGRFGAALAGPEFTRAPATFNRITKALDDATPAAAKFATRMDAKVFNDWVPAAQKAWEALKVNPAVREEWARVESIFLSLKGTALSVGPSLLQISSSLGQASAALGVSTWKLFLTTLETAAGVVNTLAGPLQTVADLMKAHPALVTAAMAGWLAFRTVPSLLSNLRTGVASVSSESAKASGVVQNLGAAFGRLQGGADRVRGLGSAFATFGGSVRDMYQQVQRIDPAMSRSQAAMATFGAVASNTARTGLGALKSAASGVIGAFGGPWGAALAGAGIAFSAVMVQNQRATQSMEAYERAIKNVGRTQVSLNESLLKSRGSINDDVRSKQTSRIEAEIDKLDAAAARTPGWTDRFKDLGKRSQRELGGKRAGLEDSDSKVISSRSDVIAQEARVAGDAKAALEGLKVSNQSLTDVVYGGSGAFQAFVGQLEGAGDGGRKLASELRSARAEFDAQQAMARKATPGISELAKAMQALGDKTATAADKSNALKTALDALNPARTLGDAIAAHDKVLQQVADSTQEAVDQTKGFGAALLDAKLGVSTATTNGQALRTSLLGIVDASKDAVAGGQSINEVMGKNGPQLAALAKQYGVTVAQIQAAFNTLGGKDLELVARVSGAPESVQQIGMIARAMKDAKIGEKQTIPISVSDDAKKAVEALGFTVDRINGGTAIEVTAKTDEAKAKLTDILNTVQGFPPGTQVKIDAPGGQGVLELLNSLNAKAHEGNNKTIEVSAPNAPGVDALLASLNLKVVNDNGKNIIVSLSGAEAAATTLNQLAKDRIARINVVTGPTPFAPGMTGTVSGGGVTPSDVTPYANGSIRSYANGGFDGRLPSQALMQRGRGRGLVQWAEGETGVESFIPWAAGKRRRSTMILSETARAFGYQLVRPGDFFQKFADGGISIDRLKDFASGITSGTYTFGGSADSWNTDCSGGQARVLNFLTGAKGRFATGNMAEATASRGLTPGLPPAGTAAYLVGWYNGGPGGGHASGAIIDADGTKTIVEMGGSSGNGSFGSGTDPATMANTAWLPLSGASANGSGDVNQFGDGSTGGSETSGGGGAKSYGGGGFGRVGTAIAEALFGSRSSGGGGGAGGGVGSAGGAKTVDAKKVREAQDKATDAEKKLAVEQQKLTELEADKKTKASALQAQKDRVEKAKREAAQAKDDVEAAKKGSPSTTVGSAAKQLTAAQDKADAAEKAAADAKTKLAEIEANPKATASAKQAAKDRVEKTRRDADQAKTDLEAIKKGGGNDKGTGDKSDTSEFQSLGQNLVSGMFQAIGLDGSLFSNPFEWPNVKSAMALLNWGGGLAKSLSGSDSENMGGVVGGAAGGIGLNLPNIGDFLKPIEPQAPVVGPGGALPIQQPGSQAGVTYDFRGAQLGVSPTQMTQKIDSRQNAAFRRQSGALAR